MSNLSPEARALIGAMFASQHDLMAIGVSAKDGPCYDHILADPWVWAEVREAFGVSESFVKDGWYLIGGFKGKLS